MTDLSATIGRALAHEMCWGLTPTAWEAWMALMHKRLADLRYEIALLETTGRER